MYSSMLNSDTVYTHSLIRELRIELSEKCVKKSLITVASEIRADMLSASVSTAKKLIIYETALTMVYIS